MPIFLHYDCRTILFEKKIVPYTPATDTIKSPDSELLTNL